MQSLLTHPNFEALGDEVEALLPGKINRVRMKFGTFDDGWPNFFIDDVKNTVEHEEVTYVGDFSRPEDVFANYAAIRGILDYYAEKVRVVVPYFPVGTMERISKKGEVATASYYADILSHLPEGRAGKTSLHTFDIHALSERFFFDSFKVNLELHSAMKLLEIPEGAAVVFPDDGAAKRFGDTFPNHEKIVCIKIREGDKRIISIKEGDPAGKDVVIVDDLIQTGGTLREAADLLRAKGAKSVTAFAPHGVFPGGSEKRLAEHVDRLVVTNSLPQNVARAQSLANMTVLSVAPLVAKIIDRATR